MNQDTTTQGNWRGVYGADGYNVIADQASNPAYVIPAPTGQTQFTWAASTSDVRALQKASNPADRIAGGWYSYTSFTLDLPITDGNLHQLALYFLDWDTTARRQTVDILDGNGNVLNTRSLTSSFNAGVYLVWNVSGHVKARVTLTGGANAVMSGFFFAPTSGPGAATFVNQDATTQGNWRGVYGANGYNVISDQALNPAYVTPAPTGQTQFVWTPSTSDVRALQKATNPADRIAAGWYSNTTFTVDLPITDANTHQLALYFLDWDTTARRQRVDILDGNGNVLSTQSLTSSFHNGVYLVWNVSGHVKARVTLTGGANAVISGLFFATGSAGPDFTITASPTSQTVVAGGGTSYTVKLTSIGGFNTSVSLSATGWPSGAAGTFSPASLIPTAAGATSTLNVTTGSNTPGGTSSINIQASGSINHNTSASLTVNSTTYVLQTVNDLISCAAGTLLGEAPSPTPVTCQLAAGTYTIPQTVAVSRSNVTISGASSNRSQTALVRGLNNTSPMVRIGVSQSQPVNGVTIQNLTFCGSNTLPNQSPSASCPTRQLTSCGNGSNCVDLSIDNADSGQTISNPFSYTGPYSFTVANCDFEDATGHAILFQPAAPDKVNDVYIHDSAINSSAVTGIHADGDGPNNVAYERKICDGDPTFKDNTTSVFLPRDIRIEGNTFNNNNTGAIGMQARYVGLRNNHFNNNYINPQAGNTAGGSVFFNQCADTIQISGNTMVGPSPSTFSNTSGLELWGRNITVNANNNISGYPNEGIGLNSVYNTTILGNTITDNDKNYPGFSTGGILVWTSGPGGPCQQIPRDTQTVMISGNTSTGQADGIRFGDRSLSRNTISGATVTSDNILQPNSFAPIELDNNIVTLNAYSGAAPALKSQSATTPRSLAIDVGQTLQKCLAPGVNPAVFTFEGSDLTGTNNILALDAVFSVGGSDTDGSGGPSVPQAGVPVCHFKYFLNTQVLYLDGPDGTYNWAGGHSVIGTGGVDLTNSDPNSPHNTPKNCIVHAGSPSHVDTTQTHVLDLILNIEFLSPSMGTHQHMYTLVENNQSQWSNGQLWKYWGYWVVP